MENLKGILILANTELDSCLAASLVVENINYIQGIKYRQPTPEELENQNSTNDDDLDEEPDYLLQNLQLQSSTNTSIISNLSTNLDIAFCDEELVMTNAWKITNGYALIFLIGYQDVTFRKILKNVLSDNQEMITLGQTCSTLLLAQAIEWGPRRDHWANIRIAASFLWQQEYLGMKIYPPYPVGKKTRRQAEKIINDFRYSWKIAYNLYKDDSQKFHLFFVEFMNQVANDIKSQFIKELLELESELIAETLKINQEITDQGQGIGYVKTGTRQFFKTDVLLQMNHKGYCHGVIEYQDQKETKTLNCNFNRQAYTVDGPFKKSEMISRN
jgi:hypothetical protein